MQQVDFVVRDTLFDPSGDTTPVSYYKNNSGRYRYKVWLYIEGAKLFFVDYVVYKLHSSFINPERKVYRELSNPKCALQIWTYGVFNVHVIIYLKTGEVIPLEHYLSYGNQLREKDLKFNDTGSYSGNTTM